MADKEEKQISSDIYKPSKAEEKLLEALSDPANRQKSVTDICQAADISRDTYYRAFNKPEFVEYYKQIGLEILKQKAMPLINIGIKEAEAGSFNHWKVLMEMSQLYTPKQVNELTGKDGGPIQHEVKQLTDEQLEQEIANLQKMVGGTD